MFVPSLAAQDWTVLKTIAVGKSPNRAVLALGGQKLYVSNAAGTISVIDTKAAEVIKTIKTGDSSGTLVSSHDGRHVYALVQGAARDNGSKLQNALGIINSADDSIQYLELPGQRWDELAITRDDTRLYLTQVVDGVASFYGAVYLLNLDNFRMEKVVREDGCPVGIVLSKDERQLFVNYQCFGPGGYTAHDAIGVYEVPSYKRVRMINGLPNVGGELALSPDGARLWAQGFDACSRPDYPHDGCPMLPSRVVNVIRTSDLKLVKSYGFSLEDQNGRISFAPNGDAFVGDGIYLKEVSASDLDVIKRIPIASAGEVAFQSNGKTAYVTVSDKNIVDVLVSAPAGAAATGTAESLTMQTVLNVMPNPSCAQSPGPVQAQLAELESTPKPTREQSEAIEDLRKKVANCYWVDPARVASVLAARGVSPLETKGKAPIIKADTNVYSAVAEQLASSGRPDDIAQIPRLLDMKTDSQYVNSLPVQSAKQELERLYALGAPTSEQKNRIKELQELIRSGEKSNAGSMTDVEIRDVTGRLGANSDRLSKEMQAAGGKAVVLYTVVGDHSYHTILVSPDAPATSWEGRHHDGHSVGREELRELVSEFRAQLRYPDEDPRALAAQLCGILIGEHEAQFQNAKTLVWVLDDDLRYIPTAALYDEKSRQYLVERYSNVVLTRSDAFQLAPPTGDLKALAAGVSESREGLPSLPGVTQELSSIFYEEGTNRGSGLVPAKILVNNAFTAYSLRAALRQSYPLVHIASHFVFDDLHPEESFLLTGGGKLSLAEIRDPVNGYSFKGIELVTLSACETAKGSDSSNGIEIQSLGEILERGAWAVMATLWEINDTSTSAFMQRFYSALEEHKSKAEALRTAQLALLCGDAKCSSESSRYSHPFYWAAFILTGDWR